MTTDRLPLPTLPVPSILLLDDAGAGDRERNGESLEAVDPAALMLTCANCGAAMDERKCKLICRCGYFLSCSDYY